MLLRTHIVFSSLVALMLIDYLKIQRQLLFMIVVLLFTLMPDIDEKTSFISKKIKISFLLRLFTSHRGIFHTVLIPFVLMILFYSINQKTVAFGILTGYVSHLFLDSITKRGIMPLYPIKKKLRGFLVSGSFFEKILFFVLVLLNVLYLVFLL